MGYWDNTVSGGAGGETSEERKRIARKRADDKAKKAAKAKRSGMDMLGGQTKRAAKKLKAKEAETAAYWERL